MTAGDIRFPIRSSVKRPKSSAAGVRCDRTVANTLAPLAGNGGRLFILGRRRKCANASHAVNDFPKICGFERMPHR